MQGTQGKKIEGEREVTKCGCKKGNEKFPKRDGCWGVQLAG